MEDMEGLLPGEDKEATMGEAVPRAPRRVKWIPSIFCVGLFMLLVGFIITVVNIAHMARADDFCFKRSTFYSKIYNHLSLLSCSVFFFLSHSKSNCQLLSSQSKSFSVEYVVH